VKVRQRSLGESEGGVLFDEDDRSSMNPQASAGATPRPLADWVAEAVEAVVGACHPQRVVLFGSVARGEERPDSDIDLLVIIDDDADTLAVSCAAVRAVARLEAEVEVVVVRASTAKTGADRPGTVLRPALRDGKVLYTRAA